MKLYSVANRRTYALHERETEGYYGRQLAVRVCLASGRQLAVILALICASCQLLFNNPQPTVSSQRLVILYSNSAIRLLSASPCQPVAAPDRPDTSACGCDQ